ncbi:MAG: hypothetical protein H6Q90_2785 [Deltaproteobacteria bacterium]|nr:hypothetical protein [Deltaproteobacteria bacterium]
MRTLLLLAAVLAACAATPPPTADRHPGSRGMRADDHLDAAREHARRADELSRWPDARRQPPGAFTDSSSGIWYRSLDTSHEHDHLAAAHRASAASLHTEYTAACSTTPADEISVSPLQQFGIGGSPTANGVVVYLTPAAGPPDRLLARLRCHRAWMMLSESGMDDCPLDLSKIEIHAHGDANGISVEITTPEPKLVPELQRRAAHDLEIAASHPH